MTGAEQQAAIPPLGTVDLHTRLAKLRHDAKRRVPLIVLPIVIPLTLLIGYALIYLPTRIAPIVVSPYVNVGTGIVFPLIMFGVVGFLVFKWSMALMLSKLNTAYKQTTWILHNTDFAVMIADEQFVMRILDKSNNNQFKKWMSPAPPVSLESRMWFSASYQKAICSCYSGEHHRASGALGTSAQGETTILRGKHFMSPGTPGSSVFAWIASLLSIISLGSLGIFFLPILFFYTYGELELRGRLVAICDFFNGTCEVDVSQLTAPNYHPLSW